MGGRKDESVPQVDLFDPAFKANPYPTYAELRSVAPISWRTSAS
jgi:hypothetical protein